jgi:hypothetical protein
MVELSRLATLSVLLPAVGLGVGCVRRTIEITSTPSDALVWVNTREVGRTPVTFEFTYEGSYDVRLERKGSEPLVTFAATDPPIWDLPGPDFFAEIAPFEINRTVAWHFELQPAKDDPDALLARAGELRAQLASWAGPKPDPEAAETTVKPVPAHEGGGLMGPQPPFGRPALPPDTTPGVAPVQPPELYPQGGGIQPN